MNKIKESIRSAYYENRDSANLIISILLVVCIFSIGYILGASAKKTVIETGTQQVVDTQAPQTQAPQTTAIPTEDAMAEATQPSTAAPATSDTAPSNQAAPADPTTTQAPSTSAAQPGSATPSTVAEILALYNESANKVKGSATKVTKNFEKRTAANLVVPDVLQSIGEKYMNQYMGDDTEPIEYTTPEDIRNEFIVPDQDYVSKLTEADVVEATCTDNGTEYEIMIKVIDQKNPTAGTGVGAGFDVLETADIMNSPASSMLESFDVTYTNCVLKCKINKDTKNMIWASYYTPVRFEIVAKFLGKTYDVSMDLSFDKDYTITY